LGHSFCHHGCKQRGRMSSGPKYFIAVLVFGLSLLDHF
jgi:hypothetical protein